MLTLAEAIKTGRLQEFIAQEEKRGIGPADCRDLERAIKRPPGFPLLQAAH